MKFQCMLISPSIGPKMPQTRWHRQKTLLPANAINKRQERNAIMWQGLHQIWWTAPTAAVIGSAIEVPGLVRIEVGISATPLAGIEGVGQHLARSIEFIAIAVLEPVKRKRRSRVDTPD